MASRGEIAGEAAIFSITCLGAGLVSGGFLESTHNPNVDNGELYLAVGAFMTMTAVYQWKKIVGLCVNLNSSNPSGE